MEVNSGLPPEIMVLCTTSETKEHAVRLLEWIRAVPEIQSGLAREPAIPAICSLIASEQLGNTVVTERRAQQWSQTTPENFKTIMNDVRKLIIASRNRGQPKKRRLTYKSLIDEFCLENALPHMMSVEDLFRKAPGSERWQVDSEIVQAGIFFWTCRWRKIPTVKSIEEIQKDLNFFHTDLRNVEEFLEEHCSSLRPHSSKVFCNSSAASSLCLTISPSEPHPVTPSERNSTSTNVLTLGELAREFGVGEDAVGGMRFLEKTVREQAELRDLVDWDSTMGRCVIFYWTCSVLKIPSAKHITLRNQYNLGKKGFDKLLSVLDLHRADLRKKLEAFYAGNPALQLLPQSTQWPATSPANLKPHNPSPADLVLEKSISPARRAVKKGAARRGRPPKPKSPPPISTEPTSAQEESLRPMCQGPTLSRALVLLRSFNARRLPASDANRVPPRSLPALVALLASQQLGDGQIGELRALQASHLSPEEFRSTLTTVRTLIDNFHSGFEEYAGQTAFDSLALEHGLSLDAVISMLHVRESLKESLCLSIGMDWDSPLVICSVFFWTCAILKVPDVKQSLLRSRSLASKREFDSVLQLLNSHCTVIRHQLEDDSAAGALWFAPPPSLSPHQLPSRQHPSFYGEREIYLEDLDGKSSKRMKRETATPSEYEPELSDGYQPRMKRKPGRPPMTRKPLKKDESSGAGTMKGSARQAQMFRPSIVFPPADWIPPESHSHPLAESDMSGCPPKEGDESGRRHTRYKTLDYESTPHGRFEAWKPEGDEIAKKLATYQHWVERMMSLYGPDWEQGISRVDEGTPFE